MALARAMWTHGHSVRIEQPDRLGTVWRAGFYVRLIGRSAQNAWIHYAIPSPVIVNDGRAARRFIETFPEAAPEVPGLASRRKLFGRFPFGLFYAVREDHLLILRVLHTSRHPDEWPRA